MTFSQRYQSWTGILTLLMLALYLVMSAFNGVISACEAIVSFGTMLP